MEDSQVKRTVACAVLCVFALSLVSLAADRRMVTAKAHGGQPNREVNSATIPIFKNLAGPKNLYWCCNGYLIVGSGNIYGYPPYEEALQFTTTAASVVHGFKTEVAYVAQGSASTFNLSIQTDNGGIPSGTVLTSAEMTVDSQGFGGCCAAISHKAKKKNLPAGTYWVVWAADSGSDLFAEVNVEDSNEVDPANVAYFDGTNWNAYQTTQSFAVSIH
jgi:hypothetical protein